jgi:hypothetical protein
MSEKFSEAVGNVVGDYTWLVVDALILLMILAALLGYKDFDESMQTLLRGMIVAFWGYVSISGRWIFNRAASFFASTLLSAWSVVRPLCHNPRRLCRMPRRLCATAERSVGWRSTAPA